MERYLVFARAEYDEPLEHRGEVEASGVGRAGEFAVERFGGDWLEMTLVPEGEIYQVQGEQTEVEGLA